MSATSPRLSIVLVTWNALENVRDLVDAIRELTQDPYELVVVDNASTDGTREHLRRFAGLPGFRLVENETNVLCAAATNQALALCRTELVVYLCASHALVTEPGWDRVLVRVLDEHPELAIAGDVWNPYGFLLASRRYKPGWSPEAHGRARLEHVQGGAFIARRSLFLEHGDFNVDEYPQGGTDVELSYRLLSHGVTLGRHPAIACPPWPEKPELRPGVVAYHPASPALRAAVRERVTKASVP